VDSGIGTSKNDLTKLLAVDAPFGRPFAVPNESIGPLPTSSDRFKGSSRRTAHLPARDWVTFSINSRLYDPVSMHLPGVPSRSTMPWEYESRSWHLCISSSMALSGRLDNRPLGSSSANCCYLGLPAIGIDSPAGGPARAVLPDCLGPVTRTTAYRDVAPGRGSFGCLSIMLVLLLYNVKSARLPVDMPYTNLPGLSKGRIGLAKGGWL
jgi:hypothetical protein